MPTPTKYPAHQFQFEVNTGTEGAPDWVPIGGINTWSPSPTDTTFDTTDFDSIDEDGNAYTEHMPVRRGMAWTLGGQTMMDVETGDRDPGQAAVEALARKTGPAAFAGFRQVHRPTGITKTCVASYGGIGGGGGNDDGDNWGVTVTASGPITDSTLPALPAAPTSVVGTTDDAHSVISWTDGTGTPFIEHEVVVYEAGVETKRVRSTAKPIYVPLGNDVAVTAKVRSRNAAGWGPLSTASASITPTD